MSSERYNIDEVKNPPWKDERYHYLPWNIRNMINLNEMKSKHEKWWNRLAMLNDKLMVFNKTFDQKLPNFERSFLEKKYNTLKDQLNKEKEEYEHKMLLIKSRIKKKIRGFGPKSSNWDIQSSNSGSSYSQFSTPYIVSSTPYQNSGRKYLSTSYS